MNPTLILKLGGGFAGIGGGITGSVFSSFHAFTKISIENLLKDDLLNGDDNADWKILQGKLDKTDNKDDKLLQLSNLKELKKQNGSPVAGNENGKKLKEWCDKKRNLKIKKFFPSQFETFFLNYVKEFCILLIGDKITESNKFTSDKEKALTTKTTELSNHVTNNNTNRGDISREQGLSRIKEISGTNNEKEKALFEWCGSTYKKSYKNKDDNLWKLANHYCKKTTSSGV